MIYKLIKSDYEKARSIFKGLEYNLIISAVIDATSPGRIYVDDISHPKTAFLCSVEGCYLAGYEDNDEFNAALGKLVTEIILTRDNVEEDEDGIFIDFHPDNWETKLGDIFTIRAPLKNRRRRYTCRKLKVNWKNQIPDGYSIHRIDGKLLERPGLKIPSHVTYWMKTNWGSIEYFMQKGFGFCMLHGNKMVSWCIADCVSGNQCEVGIHTAEEYRKRGLATLTVAATVDYCLSYGFISVGWHCDEDNIGSWKTAEKVGFEKTRDYVFHYCMFDEVYHLAETGFCCFKAKQYKECAQWYEKVFAMGGDYPHYYYHLAALAWAALGNRSTAIRYLNAAIDKGWTDIDFTKSCEQFRSLYGTSEWQNVLMRLQEKLDEFVLEEIDENQN
ncbi:GNAT family N-acetyltransferase [bacterium]|nr:GNAT family N-acetyltransferase [bacterium]